LFELFVLKTYLIFWIRKLYYCKNDSIDKVKFEDDLPKFLSSINSYQLEKLIENIQNNSVSYKDSICKLYTIHSYKGMEDDNIRMADDIDINNYGDSRIEENLYYVAITRGMKKIIMNEA
jgi:superfamily I DNA/RNA helicase